MSYDPEAIYQDADLEAAEMTAVGNAIDTAQARGACCHLSAVGYRSVPLCPEQEGLKPGQLRCRDGCGEVFANEEDWWDAIYNAVEV